jgi:hypothetical protein
MIRVTGVLFESLPICDAPRHVFKRMATSVSAASATCLALSSGFIMVSTLLLLIVTLTMNSILLSNSLSSTSPAGLFPQRMIPLSPHRQVTFSTTLANYLSSSSVDISTLLTSSKLSSALSLSSSITTTISSEPTLNEDDESESYVVFPNRIPSDQWELDCYSRPVIMPEDGKKLWEVLITDRNRSFQYMKRLPSNAVNSKTLRQVVDSVMERAELPLPSSSSTPSSTTTTTTTPVVSPIKPSCIRFFRGAMFNMIKIALSELPVSAKPSRCTWALALWIEDRMNNVYPKMKGYNGSMLVGGGGASGGKRSSGIASTSSSTTSFLNIRTPIKLPDSLRGESYAFVGLPVAEFRSGGGVSSDNIGVGQLCPVPNHLPGDVFIPGVVILSQRAKALSSWLSGTELVSITADLRKRILLMETDIDTCYLMARLNDEQRAEGAIFEQGKDEVDGLHFVSVQVSDNEDPAGFWLLRTFPSNL